MPGRDWIRAQVEDIEKNMALRERAGVLADSMAAAFPPPAPPPPSLHAAALASAGLSTDDALTDRQLAIALLEWGTRIGAKPNSPRWAAYPMGHGSRVSWGLLRAAGLDPEHVPREVVDDDDEGCER